MTGVTAGHYGTEKSYVQYIQQLFSTPYAAINENSPHAHEE